MVTGWWRAKAEAERCVRTLPLGQVLKGYLQNDELSIASLEHEQNLRDNAESEVFANALVRKPEA